MKGLLAGLAALLVAAGILAVVLVLVHSESTPEASTPSCTEVDVGFATDELMRANVDKFKANKQVVNPVGETKQDGYQRFMARYRDDPSMRSMVSADTYPANIRVNPAAGVDREQLKADLRLAYPNATIQDPCNIPSIPGH